jgi:murein DD-endopeptidase MepM/ murein hydrolase activator NlpD
MPVIKPIPYGGGPSSPEVDLAKAATIKRLVSIMVGASFALGTFAAIANADSALSRALHSRKMYVHELANIGDARRVARSNLNDDIRTLHRSIIKIRVEGSPIANDRQRLRKQLRHLIGARLNLRVHLRGLERYIKHRTDALRTRRSALTAWIQRYGILRTCPVRGQHVVANNFGYIVQKRPGVPRHAHVGNDITAAYGTPIVAPFDGTAVASTNALGGLAVKVYGDAGYAYNAHLSSYGRLGAVTLGDVIGYVGTTGDAGGPHDHFEWHPGDGSAVDPYPYLMAVC